MHQQITSDNWTLMNADYQDFKTAQLPTGRLKRNLGLGCENQGEYLNKKNYFKE